MKSNYKNDIERYGSDILKSEELQHAYYQTHHTWSTVGEHTLRVAAASLAICYALRKIHISTDTSAVVKGALCHDLRILGRYEKYKSNKECSRRHPADSVEIARRLVEDLSEKSADIIERHMWPAGNSKAPNSLECVIVSVADKYAAIKDLVQGSEIKHTGIKNKVHDILGGDDHDD
ncbi:MAG: HD domain-containing protein [Anaerolineaceae bacterium]|nr:HD domain-containing protein [Anaerolineaceae bacterium]